MQTVCTSLSNRVTQSHTWKMSIIIGIASFIISLVLPFFINYLVQKYGKRFAKLMRTEKGITPRPVLIFTDDQYQTLNIHPDCRMLKVCCNYLNSINVCPLIQWNCSTKFCSSDGHEPFCQQLANNLKQV